jgi:hypothetical protein
MIVLVFAFVLSIACIETVLYAGWATWYYTCGFPVFRRTFRLKRDLPLPILGSQLESIIPSSQYLTLLVRQMRPNTFAFREKLFDLTALQYPPLMRCLLKIDPIERCATVTGFINIFPVILTLGFIMVPVLAIISGQLLFGLCALACLSFGIILMRTGFSIQVDRIDSICRTLEGT